MLIDLLCFEMLICLVFCAAKLKELWIIPIFFVVVTGFSGLVAAILSRIFMLKKSQRCVFHYCRFHVRYIANLTPS